MPEEINIQKLSQEADEEMERDAENKAAELDAVELVEFPDVQKVEVINQVEPEIKVNVQPPEVNVNVPDVVVPPFNIPEPKVSVTVEENTSQNAILEQIRTLLEREPEQFDEEDFIKKLGEEFKDKLDFKTALKGFHSSGWLPVVQRMNDSKIVSTLNSSTTALDDGTNFTGTWEDVTQYNAVIVAVKTDQNGYLEIQFSPDGINADSTLTRYYSTNQIEPPHEFVITRQYCRIRYFNNSGSNQTYLRLQTKFTDNVGQLNVPLDATVAQDYDATVVRPTDYKYEISLGLRQGATAWNKWGGDVDLDTADGERTVWSAGANLSPLTSAETFNIAYDGTGGGSTDGAGTNGATELTFYYLDANRALQVASHTLGTDGTDTTSFSGLGINRVIVTGAGSGLTNASAITITATTAGSIQAHLPANEGVTDQAFFFTQNNHKFLADWLAINVNKIGVGSQPIVTIKGFIRDFDAGTRIEFLKEVIDTAVENTVTLNPSLPFVVQDNALLEFVAQTTINDTDVRVRFSGVEFKDVNA